MSRLTISFYGSSAPYSIEAIGWSRDFALLGGINEGTFTYSDSNPVTPKQSHKEWLLADIREGNTWRGFVNSVSLVYPRGVANESYMYSLSPSGDYPLWNDITTYSDADSNEWQAQDDTSIARYGVHQAYTSVDGNNVSAQNERDSLLAQFAYPQLVPVRPPVSVEKVSVYVNVLGYLYTALWKTATDSPVNDRIGSWIDHWVSNCDFLTAGDIFDNTQRMTEPEALKDGAKKSIYHGFQEALTHLNQNGDRMRLWVDVDNKVNYQPIDTSERYFMRGGKYYSSQTGKLARPRDMRVGYIGNRDTGATVLYNSIGMTTDADGQERITTSFESSAIGALLKQ